MPTFLIITRRPSMMWDLVQSWMRMPWRDQYDAIILFQDYAPEEQARMLDLLGPRVRASYTKAPTPPFLLRTFAYREHPDIRTWVLLDDDMVFTEETNFRPIIERLENDPLAGCISANWIRTASPALRARAKYEDTFVRQPIVYTGGGMLFRRDVAELLLGQPILPYAFDDVQTSLTAYVAGLMNYRYLGSLLVHRITHSGGLNQAYRERAFTAPPEAYIKARPLARDLYAEGGQNHHIPGPSDLTDYAHEEHRRNRARLMHNLPRA